MLTVQAARRLPADHQGVRPGVAALTVSVPLLPPRVFLGPAPASAVDDLAASSQAQADNQDHDAPFPTLMNSGSAAAAPWRRCRRGLGRAQDVGICDGVGAILPDG